MKTLKDHVILYDAVCPMCNLYTKGFLQYGMLEKNGRLPYQAMPDNIACSVDKVRMVNEIALVNTESGEVVYGVESLTKIIGNAFPKLQFLFRCETFNKTIDKLYKFVSFNRRVIAPNKKDEVNFSALDPSFHKTYRIAYLVFAWLTTAFVLYKYSLRLPAIMPLSNIYREFFICGGQIVWQGMVVGLVRKTARWDYLGNMMTISLAGAVLLLFGLTVGKATGLHNVYVYAGWFIGAVILMFLEHLRRTRLLNLNSVLSATWVLYRVLVLLTILFLSYVK